MDDEIIKLLDAAATDGIIECPQCGQLLEPDCPACMICGWKNRLVLEGLI
jgi:hypothetical protein